MLDKQKKYAEAEAVFRQLIAREPENAAALNYLGYMLAERGERLDESVGYLKRALEIEPENGSYLDSLGWAYFKADKLDLAHENLRRAADQLQDQLRRPGSLRRRALQARTLRRCDRRLEPRARRRRRLDRRGDIDRKIRSARQKLPETMSRRRAARGCWPRCSPRRAARR